MSEISVFGSINMDLVINLEDFPRPGQTIKVEELDKTPGGKGANQAVAAAKLGGEVSMYGALGDDNYGDILKGSLESSGVKTERIERRFTSSGLAIVMVNKKAENEIVIMSGANEMVGGRYAKRVFKSISKSEVLLLQLETPLPGIKELLKLLPDGSGPKIILDPAPAVPLQQLPFAEIDILTPNEEELVTLVGDRRQTNGIERILNNGVGSLVIKRGEKGAQYIDQEKKFTVPPFDISAVDTTGAGDVFNGALAVALVEGQNMEEALQFANAAGARAAMENGAQPSTLTLDSVKQLQENQKVP